MILVHIILCVLMSCGGDSTNRGSLGAQQAQSLPQPTISDLKRTDETTLIKPGRSIGLLQLDNTREQALKLLGEKYEEYAYDSPCKYSEMHWYDRERDRNGVFIYLRNGHIFQIEAATPRYRTVDGISEESSPEDVRRGHQQLQSYALLRSGADVVGGRDLIYWVDRQNGIAFEFYYNGKAGQRRVSKVIVFEPGGDFKPEGCVSPPQELVELEPFALEPSSKQRRK